MEYWNNGKTQRLKLEAVRCIFRMVRSTKQLHKWAAQIQNRRLDREKVFPKIHGYKTISNNHT